MEPLRLCRLFAILLLAGFVPAAWSQAVSTAYRSAAIGVYVTGQRTSTDYNSTDFGLTVGGDFTYHFRWFDPSLDVRYNKAPTGAVVGESSFAGGLKVEKTFHDRFHPYLDFLVGFGTITFDTPIVLPNGSIYASDDSKVYNIGAGLDYDLSRSFSIKLDGQYQFWHIGAGVDLSPNIIGVGIVYHIPYQRLRH